MSTNKKSKVLRRGTKKDQAEAMKSPTPQKHMIFRELLEENRITKAKIRAVENKIAAHAEKQRLKK